MVFAILGPSDALGEVALFDGMQRSASVEVLEPVTALALPLSTLQGLLRTDPRAVDALLASAGALLRRLTIGAADLVFLDLEGRVAKLLVAMGERKGRATPSGVEIELGMSQSDIGRMVGGSRQSVNQIFRGFEARGFIEPNGRTVVLTGIGALRRRAAIEA
jgi:CRP-like cAMP-binding protein